MKRYFKNIILILLVLLTFFITSCAKKTYVVVFDYGYNNIITTQEVKKGDIANIPKSPVRDRYNFLGWYLDSNFSNIYDTNTKIYDNTTIYAKWEAINIHRIILNYNGGVLEEEIPMIEFADAADVSLPSPTKENYDFDGWYENGNKIEVIENRDYVLTARYNAKYSVVPALTITPFRTKSEIYQDVTYKIVGGEELKMDIYLPPLEEGKKAPVLFMYFGGGFMFGDKTLVANMGGSGILQDIFDYVLDNNIAVVIPNYRLSDGLNVTYPLPVEDSLDAIRFCVKNCNALGIDIYNMGTIGFSAGAYMALMAGFAQDSYFGDPNLKNITYSVKYIVDMYAPSYFDTESLDKISFKGKVMLASFFGSDVFNNTQVFEKAFPSYYVNTSKPSVYIVHGEEDPLVPPSQSQNFYNLLIENGIDASILFIGGAGHMLGTASGFDQTSMSLSEIYADIASFIMREVNK